MPDLHGKIALVTGGASGLGHATARRLQADGATVVITDIQVGLGEAAATESGCMFLPQDVTAEVDRLQVMNMIRSRLGGRRIWVNNAGVLAATQAPSPEHTPLEDWRRLFAVNVDGVFLGCKTAIPAMRHSGNGSISNISSVAGLLATPCATAYGATKATVAQLTKSVAQYCAQKRCRGVPGIRRHPADHWSRTARRRRLRQLQYLPTVRARWPSGANSGRRLSCTREET